MRDKVTGQWRRIHNKELCGTYSSPNFMGVIKSRRMRYVGHVGHVGESINAHRVLVGKLRERDHWKDLGIDGNLILNYIFKK
jgi:hypothetical protein